LSDPVTFREEALKTKTAVGERTTSPVTAIAVEPVHVVLPSKKKNFDEFNCMN